MNLPFRGKIDSNFILFLPSPILCYYNTWKFFKIAHLEFLLYNLNFILSILYWASLDGLTRWRGCVIFSSYLIQTKIQLLSDQFCDEVAWFSYLKFKFKIIKDKLLELKFFVNFRSWNIAPWNVVPLTTFQIWKNPQSILIKDWIFPVVYI